MKRFFTILTVSFAFLWATYNLIDGVGYGTGYQTSIKIRSKINQKLSNKSTMNQVIPLLKSNGINIIKITSGKRNLDLESDYVTNSNGMSGISYMIVAVIPDVKYSLLDKWYQYHIFLFRSNKTLVKYKVEDRAFGL